METTAKLDSIRIQVTPDLAVSGVVGTPEWWPTGARAAIVFAHDTAGSKDTELLVALHLALADRGYLTLRFDFPFVDLGKKRPDPMPVLERTMRQAIASLMGDSQNAPARLVVGGIGLGARVASQVLAQGVKADGLVALSYPLHPSGKPTQLRAEPLFRIICPMLFVQGTRDATCRVDRMQAVLRRIGAPHELVVVEDSDHKLDLIKRSGRTQEEVRQEVIEAVERFSARSTAGP